MVEHRGALSEHSELAQVRALAEREAIPVQVGCCADRHAAAPPDSRDRDRSSTTWRRRAARSCGPATFPASRPTLFHASEANPWTAFLGPSAGSLAQRIRQRRTAGAGAVEFLYEACAESRREFSYGEGVTLSTVHSAKGTEYDHVLLDRALAAARRSV